MLKNRTKWSIEFPENTRRHFYNFIKNTKTEVEKNVNKKSEDLSNEFL